MAQGSSKGWGRLWTVLSILWVVLCGVIGSGIYDSKITPYPPLIMEKLPEDMQRQVHYGPATEAIQKWHDVRESSDLVGIQIEPPIDSKFFVSKSISEERLSEIVKKYSELATIEVEKNKGDFWLVLLLVIIVPPLALLAFGKTIYWVYQGFTTRTSDEISTGD